MKLKTMVKENERLPKFYGIAYRDYLLDVSICYVIPLNWVVRLLRSIYFKLAQPPLTDFEMREYMAFIRGREQGQKMREVEIDLALRRATFGQGYMMLPKDEKKATELLNEIKAKILTKIALDNNPASTATNKEG